MGGLPERKQMPEEENASEQKVISKDKCCRKQKGPRLSFRDRLKSLFGINDSPHKIAASFSVGTFIGISPLFGLHTLIGIFAGYLFRLNMAATMTGVYVTNPWTMIPIYTFTTWVGTKMLGVEFMREDFNISHLTFSNVFSELEHLLKPFIAGSFAIAFLSSVLLYIVLYRFVKKVQSGTQKK